MRSGNIKLRLDALERRDGDVIFTMADGTREPLRRKSLLAAIDHAIAGVRTRGANILLRARKANDGSHLHEMCQALAAGPVPPGEINESD